MNFFERQEEAKGRTTLLVILFVIAVVAVVGAVTVSTSFIVHHAAELQKRPVTLSAEADRRVMLAAAAATLALVAGGTLVRLYQLSSGGHSVARMLGGERISSDTREPDERKLLNVVEEMSIASGTPVPTVYLLAEEDAINAFAAGFDPGDAVIGVTRGAIRKLDRDELQGVIAHEFSHILNGDMRINVRLMGIVFGLLVIGLTGRFLIEVCFRSSRRSSGSKKGGVPLPLLAIGVALFVIGYVGVLCGRLIKAAISRQREFLADASAVEFTRNPDGIAGALRKIAADAGGARLHAPRAEEASHMFFGNALRPSFISALFATHPPLEERIARITGRRVEGLPRGAGMGAGGGGEGLAIGLSGGGAAGADAVVRPDVFVGRAGLPAHEHVEYGGFLLSRLPPVLREAAREPFVAQAIAHALLLSKDDDVRRRQIAQVAHDGPSGLDAELTRLAPEIARLGPAARLPLLDLALPALRSLSRAQLRSLVAGVERISAADPAPSVFAFTLGRALARHLRESLDAKARPRPGTRRIEDMGDEVRTLLGALAAAGHDDEAAARAAFAEAAGALGLPAHDPPIGRGKVLLEKLDAALDRLALLGAAPKGRLLSACALLVAHDGVIHVAEAELVRAVADSLGCPVPPVAFEVRGA